MRFVGFMDVMHTKSMVVGINVVSLFKRRFEGTRKRAYSLKRGGKRENQIL